MNRQLRRVGTLILLMFLALFCSTTIIQVFSADQLKADPRNIRTLDDSYSAERGEILDADGDVLAKSVPSKDVYKYQRVYTNPELYADVTGYFTFNQANPGIEGALNDYLSGSANGEFLSNLSRIATGQAVQGASVELTIDPKVQEAAYNALRQQHRRGRRDRPEDGRDPRDGVEAVVRPEHPVRALDHEVLRGVQRARQVAEQAADESRDRGRPVPPRLGVQARRRIRGTRQRQGDAHHGVPQPRSAQAAAVDRLHPQLDTKLPCGPGATATIATAIRLSCNIPIAQLGAAIGESTISEYATRFGFGQTVLARRRQLQCHSEHLPDRTGCAARHAVGLRAERRPGHAPADCPRLRGHRKRRRRNAADADQEDHRAGPVGTARCSRPTVYGTPISSATADEVRDMMISSVADGAASNARIEGVQVAGKTGTAQNGVSDPYTLWFTGFAPADDPQVVVAVVVENGGGQGQDAVGNQIAAPIGKAVLEAVLNK